MGRTRAVVRISMGRLVIQRHGFYWPDDTSESEAQHAIKHVWSVEWAIARCGTLGRQGTAVQAGGNVGLWPHRLSDVFDHVRTFEPDRIAWECLRCNVPARVIISREALGQHIGLCNIKHRALGSARIHITKGREETMTTIDDQQIEHVDFLQLDVEGYEWHALQGARDTIARCKPLIQVELRGFTEKYGKTDDDVRAFLHGFGYEQVSAQSGSDYVFECVR